MNTDFSRSLALLRQEKGVSQRVAAQAMGISQALLSHYEKGIREPGLAFVTKACDYYNVSADFLLGRTLSRDGTTILDADTLFDASEDKSHVLKGSVMATLAKKLLVNSIDTLFDLLGKTGSRLAIKAATEYLSTAIYKLFRYLYRVENVNNEDFFSIPKHQFLTGAPTADMLCCETDYVDALVAHMKDKGSFPPMDHATLTESYPGQYQSLLQIIHTTGERINRNLRDHRKDDRK